MSMASMFVHLEEPVVGYKVDVNWEWPGGSGREMEKGTKGGRILTETLVAISGTCVTA